MTNDTFTEEQIREASLFDGVNNIDQLIAALKKPKVEFAEGQVLVHQGRDGDLTFVQWGNTSWTSSVGLRPLNLTEQGPAVRELRDAMNRIAEDAAESNFAYSVAVKALERFKESHHD